MPGDDRVLLHDRHRVARPDDEEVERQRRAGRRIEAPVRAREVERPEHASSNVVNAHKLQGKVLLVVGELDTNVDPCATMQVVNALIKASKTFDLPVIPGAGHGPGGAYGERKRYDFFVQHLLGVMPPAWNAVADKTPPGR